MIAITSNSGAKKVKTILNKSIRVTKTIAFSGNLGNESVRFNVSTSLLPV